MKSPIKMGMIKVKPIKKDNVKGIMIDQVEIKANPINYKKEKKFKKLLDMLKGKM